MATIVCVIHWGTEWELIFMVGEPGDWVLQLCYLELQFFTVIGAYASTIKTLKAAKRNVLNEIPGAFLDTGRWWWFATLTTSSNGTFCCRRTCARRWSERLHSYISIASSLSAFCFLARPCNQPSYTPGIMKAGEIEICWSKFRGNRYFLRLVSWNFDRLWRQFERICTDVVASFAASQERKNEEGKLLDETTLDNV